MGRKGVSKRKSKQTSSKSRSNSAAGNPVSSASRSEETPLVKSLETGKTEHANNRKQNSKKG